LLRQTGLLDAADTLVMKFSSGMYQRLGIARALIKKPSVVLLDEPTRSLDPGSAAQFWNLVRSLPSEGATVILATHNFNEAVAVGNDVAILYRGSIVAERHLSSTMSMDELRSFYFEATGELEEVETMESRGGR
jgi:ABC-2 type transport system ATP-binding protein